MYELRPYQREAVDAVFEHLHRKDNNPCVVIPTAGGKSICIAEVAKTAVSRWRGRVLILAHVKELVDQNAKELESICPGLPVGVYSAGLDRRDTEQDVIVAGIQSVYNRIDAFKRPFDLVMVDEVHMVPPDGEGRYQTFLRNARQLNPHVRMIGWTATPFRTHGGLICKDENIFNEICYEANVRDLIDSGFISKITAHSGTARANLENLHIRAGEFVSDEVDKAMGEEHLILSACSEIVEKTRDRKACLIFCTSKEHCRKVAATISRFSGEECAVVNDETSASEREQIIARMKGESVPIDLFGNVAPPLKYCCNVSVMTTGTNIRRLDTIALLRPTASPGLFIQMVGRGFRLSPETGKTECLVLDYGRNIERFGPIDAIEIRDPAPGGARGPLAKECPECHNMVAPPTLICPECGYQFPVPKPERRMHEAHADNAAILSGEVKVETVDVVRTDFQVWTSHNAKPGAPQTVRVTYWEDMVRHYSEWICPGHDGYARAMFEAWWRLRAAPSCPVPDSAQHACDLQLLGMLRETRRITLKYVSGERFPKIIDHELGDFPAPPAGSGPGGSGIAELLDEEIAAAGADTGEAAADDTDPLYDDLPF